MDSTKSTKMNITTMTKTKFKDELRSYTEEFGDSGLFALYCELIEPLAGTDGSVDHHHLASFVTFLVVGDTTEDAAVDKVCELELVRRFNKHYEAISNGVKAVRARKGH
jgi:hypothetical protein